ncbi:MAG: glycosyltransferase family 39 protein [Acidobacteria bacterium]|nr:glycosyltransferase family 39 protein [Acidobacteriota bacterium]
MDSVGGALIDSKPGYSRWILRLALPFYFLLILALQHASGTYQAGFNCSLRSYGDEAGHYVTGLMVRDYLHGAVPQNPLTFASHFYLHYPLVALGHWPPGFYALQSVWTTFLPSTRESLLVFMAMLTALLAFETHRLTRRHLGEPYGVFAGLTLVLIPLTQSLTSTVMAEVPLALASLWAVSSLAAFLRSGRYLHAILYGVLSSAAILMKGSGWLLVLIPALVALCTGGVWQMLRGRIWISAAIVAVLCVPYSLVTMRAAQYGWDAGAPNWQFAYSAATGLLRSSLEEGGVLIALLFLVGAVQVALDRSREGLAWLWFAVLAWLFHLIVPASIESRRLFMAAPVALFFAAAGLRRLAREIRLGSEPVRASVLAAVVWAVFLAFTFHVPAVASAGLDDVADEIARRTPTHSVALIASDTWWGESALVAEITGRERRFDHYLVRASKLLFDSDWMGTFFRLVYSDAHLVAKALDDIPVSTVVLHTGEGLKFDQHIRQLREVLDHHPDWKRLWERRSGLPGRQSAVALYTRRSDMSGAPLRLTIDLSKTVSTKVQNNVCTCRR